MSGSDANTEGYDPAKHDNQIVAVFEDMAAAGAARDALVDAGVPRGEVAVVARVEGDAAAGARQEEDKGVGDQVLTAFMSLLSPSDHHQDYSHAVDRGHAMVVVTPMSGADRHRIIEVLERSDPIDFDARLAEWRGAGYDALPTDESGRRTGRLETRAEPSRVRSYVADRDATAADGASTAGATTSGANAPRN